MTKIEAYVQEPCQDSYQTYNEASRVQFPECSRAYPGITSALFLLIYVADEVSYDRYH